MLDTFLKVRYLTFKTFNQPFGNLAKENSALATWIEKSCIRILKQLLWKQVDDFISQFWRGEYLVVAQIGYAGQYVRIIDVM